MILFYRSRILWQFRVEVVIIIPTTVGQESAILDGTCQEEVFSLEWQELGLTEDAGRYEKKKTNWNTNDRTLSRLSCDCLYSSFNLLISIYQLSYFLNWTPFLYTINDAFVNHWKPLRLQYTCNISSYYYNLDIKVTNYRMIKWRFSLRITTLQPCQLNEVLKICLLLIMFHNSIKCCGDV